MPAAEPTPGAKRRVALLALAIGAFGIGTTEFVVMGLLPEVATDFGVSIPSAGLLISGYALGSWSAPRCSPRSGPRCPARPC